MDRGDLASRIQHVALTNVAAGFDSLSFDADGSHRFIEVKTTTSRDPAGFFLSDNEWRFARRMGSRHFVYRVTKMGTGDEKLIVYQDIDNLVLRQELMQVATAWRIVRTETSIQYRET